MSGPVSESLSLSNWFAADSNATEAPFPAIAGALEVPLPTSPSPSARLASTVVPAATSRT